MTVSPVERMSVCLQVIEAAEVDTAEGTEQTVKALEELQDWAEDMDTAAGNFFICYPPPLILNYYYLLAIVINKNCNKIKVVSIKIKAMIA